MPRYKFALSNGKSLTMEGATQPSDTEVEAAAKAAGVTLVGANSNIPAAQQPDDMSWRNSVDPEGAMSLATLANNNPEAAVAGASAPFAYFLPWGRAASAATTAAQHPAAQAALREGAKRAITGVAGGTAYGILHKLLGL